MDIGKVLKRFQYNILVQNGVAITPEQVGLKSEDFESPFSKYLKGITGDSSSTTNPLTPPTPPEDPTDLEAQKLYNEQLLAYNQQMAAYHQRLFTLMMQQFQQSQRLALSQRQQTSSVSSASGGDDTSYLSTGGII